MKTSQQLIIAGFFYLITSGLANSASLHTVLASNKNSLSTALLSTCSANGSTYICHSENAFIHKVTELGFNLFREGFETTAWDVVRSPNSAPDVVSKGITWTTSANSITTGIPKGIGNSWAGFKPSHGLATLTSSSCDTKTPPAGCFKHDGLSGSGTGLFAVGGYIQTTGANPANISIIVNGISHSFGKKILDRPQFYGVIETTGFTTFQFLEQDGKAGHEIPVFIDNLVIGTSKTVAANNIPELTPLKSSVAKVNRTLRIAVTATDLDIDDSFKFSSSSLPAGATFEDNLDGTATFTWRPDYSQVGSYPISFTVTDNGFPAGSDTVVSTIKVNHPPVINSAPVITATENMAYSYSLLASDVDGDVLTYTDISNPALPGWINFDMKTQVLSGIPSVTDVGVLNVALQAADGNFKVNQRFNITVEKLNRPPVVDIGGPYTVLEGASVLLDAGKTTDVDGDILSYGWDLNNDGNFTDATGVSLTHRWPDNGSYSIAVKVTDDKGNIDTATTSVTVNNVAPKVNAGTDQTIKETETVKFSGSFSDQGSVDTHTILWDFGDGSAEVSETLTPDHIYMKPGQYTVTLRVIDKDQGMTSHTLTVSVINIAPVAVAGLGQKQRVKVNDQVNLNGSSSFDISGAPVTYAWSIKTKPSGSNALLSGAATVDSSFVADTSGSYVIQLIVNDGIDDSYADTVTITVNSAPVANAGEGQTTLLANSVILDGSGSTDSDGDELTFNWSILSKPTGSATGLSSASVVNPSLKIDLPGSYQVQLTVNDGYVDSQVDTVSIRTVNNAPVANAGLEQVAHISDTITLDGSNSSDTDGDDLLFRWVLISKPEGSAVKLSSVTSAFPNFVADRVGSYVAQLVVNDNQLDSVPDTVTVNINNRAPLAVIRQVEQIDEGASVLLDASESTDADGDPLVYSWDLNDDGVFDDAVGTTATFKKLENGIYPVSVEVSDGSLASHGSVSVTVNDLGPIAALSGNSILNEGSTGTFNASESSSSPDKIVSYEWDLNNNSSFTDATGVITTHSWPDNGSYTIAVKITDDDGSTDIATTTIEVNNVAPEVNTEPGQTVNEAETVKFSGSFIDPGTVDTHSIVWNFGDDSEEVGGTLTPTHVYMKPGLFIVTLRVTDNDHGTASNTSILSVSNLPPVAVAGINQSVPLNTLVNLDGSSSFDVSDAPLSYAWSIMTKPIGSTTSLNNATTVTPSFVADIAGIYVVKLFVNDGIGNSVADTVTIATH